MAATAGLPALDTVLLKVTSRCNLDCSYCYVYNMGDDAWRFQPKRMTLETGRRIAEQLGDIYRLQRLPFSAVLHGGEPLLLGPERLRELLSVLRSELPHPCGIHVQTNGILLSDRIIDILVASDVGISISIDGPAHVHDRNRVDHGGKGSFNRVMQGIERVMSREDARPLFAGVLAVIDPSSQPDQVYSALKASGAPSLDVLVRDGNWDHLPFGKSTPSSTEYGSWLIRLLDLYLADTDPPRLRLFDDMLRLILGGEAQKEGVGTADYGILVIEPDGRIDKNDTLKVAHSRADRFEAEWNIHTHRLTDVLASASYETYYTQQRPTAPACLACPERDVCGGGMVAHRWSTAAGYNNPTIFCTDQKKLIGRMRQLLADAEPASLKDVA